MARRDYTDLIGGAALIVFGAWFTWYGHMELPAGDLRRMGPGFFPMAIGVLVGIFGLLLLLPALFRAGTWPRPELRPLVTILAGGLAFAFLIEPFGMVPATLALIVVVAMAERRIRPLRTAILAVVLAAVAVLVFSEGLGIPVPAFRFEV